MVFVHVQNEMFVSSALSHVDVASNRDPFSVTILV